MHDTINILLLLLKFIEHRIAQSPQVRLLWLVWNKLSLAVTSASSVATFKNLLKTELFRQSFGPQITLHNNTFYLTV